MVLIKVFPQAANANKGHYLTLTCQSINNLQDLYGFFSTLGAIWPPHNFDTAEKEVANCLAEIEQVLANDFLEKMPSNISARWKTVDNKQSPYFV